jgi:hypothetical protein
MTNLFQAVSRHAPAAFAGFPGAAFTGHADAAQRDDAEYQSVFAVMTALFVGGTAIVLTALAHAL